MCGPIALALPVRSYPGVQKYVGIGLYNIGRAVTYGFLGLAFGFLGQQFRVWGLQQVISISVGMLILVFIFSSFSFSSRIVLLTQLNKWVQKSLSSLLIATKSVMSLFPIGLLNGLLPCGLVYVAIAAALATMHTWHGVLLMFGFGLGTIPVMAGLMMFGHLISCTARQKINMVVPYFVGMMAVMLILRGLNLGIPYLSPSMEKDSTEVSCCHKPQ
jgi:sulfite exporter TauE/SafE